MVAGFGLGVSALILLLAASPRWHGATAACFYPSGRIAPNDTPCRDDTPHAACCGQGYACLTNGICQATGEELEKPGATEFVRGACTDETWRSGSCPLFCITEDADFLDGGNGIHKCDNTTQDLYFCINSKSGEEASCEERRGLLFFAGTPSAITTIGVVPRTTTSSTSTRSTPASIIIEVSGAPPSTAPASSTAPPPNASGIPKNSGTAPTLTPVGDTTEPSSSPSFNLGPIIGGVLGGTAAVILAGVTGWLLARRRRSKAGATGSGMTGSHTHPPYYEPKPPFYGAAPAHHAEVYEAPGTAKPRALQGPFELAFGSSRRGSARGVVAELPGVY